MMSEMQENRPYSRDEVLAALPGYVLDALMPEEKSAVDAYLRQHPELMSRVRELDNAVGALAHSAPKTSMPPELKQGIMQRVRADLQTERPRLAAARGKRATPPIVAALPATKSGPQVGESSVPRFVPRESGARRFRRWWEERRYANFALGLSTALAVLLVLSLFQTQNAIQQSRVGLVDMQARLSVLEDENVALRNENQVLQRAIGEQRQQWATILAADTMIALAGTDEAPESQAVLYTDDNELLVLAGGLTPLTADQTYQLWLIPAEGDPVPAGLFGATADGIAVFQSVAPLPVTAYANVGVSIEPVGGSAAPTGPIVLLGAAS